VSAPVRFLLVAVAGWALFRGALAGILPDMDTFKMAKAETAPPPIVPSQFPPISVAEQPSLSGDDFAGYPGYSESSPYYRAYAGYPPPPRFVPIPVYYQPLSAVPHVVAAPVPTETSEPPDYVPEFPATIPQLDDWDLAQVVSGSLPGPQRQSTPVAARLSALIPPKHLDRLQLSAWALLRGQSPGTGSLASGGTLGGSQAGARLLYAFDRRIAVSLRSSSPVGGSRGGEVAAGLKLAPVPSIPLSITAERRQAIGRFSTGRSAFALFAEGGMYQQPLGWNLMLDGYGQAGLVGIRGPDPFVDGGIAVTRPVYGRFSAGFGAWGGYQPGLYRLDAGPRLSMRIRRNMSVHLDWRQRLSGTAEPGSGPALTLGADF
jgi:hypothetical protein